MNIIALSVKKVNHFKEVNPLSVGNLPCPFGLVICINIGLKTLRRQENACNLLGVPPLLTMSVLFEHGRQQSFKKLKKSSRLFVKNTEKSL